MLETRALIVPGTVNEEERTVDIVFSTGQRTLRASIFEEDFFEELSLEPGHVRLERLNSGAPVLDSHGQPTHRRGGSGLQDVLGVVVQGTAVVDGTEGRCTIRISRRAAVEDIWQDILDGVILNVSMGYLVHRSRDITGPDDTTTVLLAIDWEPFEVSLLGIPVDTGAGVRSHSQSSLCTITGEGVLEMAVRKPKTTKKAGRKAAGKAPAARTRAAEQEADAAELEDDPAGDDPEVETEGEAVETEGAADEVEGEISDDDETAGDETEGDPAPVVEGEQRSLETEPRKPAKRPAKNSKAAKAERHRVLEIQKTARTVGLPEGHDLTDKLITRAIPLADARKRLIDAAADLEDDGTMIRGQTTQVGQEQRSKVASGIENALSVRALLNADDGKRLTLSEDGRQFQGMTLLRMAEECLVNAGEKISTYGKMDLATRALHGSSDFPSIVENIANKTLRQAYDQTVLTYRFLGRQVNATDFRQMSSVQLGTGSSLLELPEGAEIKHGTLSDEAEKFSLLTYARALTLTRQAIVNDDSRAFDRLPGQLGRKAAELEQDIIWALITSNVVMGDGNALFSAAHSNIGTGALDVAGLSAGRSIMRKQTDLDGQRISAIPRILFVPTDLETEAEQLTSAINAQVAGSVNPFVGQFSQVFAEPRLSDASAAQWYMATDPGQLDVIQYGFLDGETGPRVETERSFTRDGMAWRVLHDFYGAVLDHRGLYRSSGV